MLGGSHDTRIPVLLKIQGQTAGGPAPRVTQSTCQHLPSVLGTLVAICLSVSLLQGTRTSPWVRSPAPHEPVSDPMCLIVTVMSTSKDVLPFSLSPPPSLSLSHSLMLLQMTFSPRIPKSIEGYQINGGGWCFPLSSAESSCQAAI